MPVDNRLYIFDTTSALWRKLASDKSWPCARVGHAGCAAEGKLFIHGGRTEFDHDGTLECMWVFDPKTETWAEIQQQGDVPGRLSYHSFSASANDGFIYCFGGCPPAGRSNSLHRFHIATSTWTNLGQGLESSTCTPTQRGGPSLVSVPGQGVHVLFGYNGKTEEADHWIFNVACRSWTNATVLSGPSPAARSVTDVVFLNNVGKDGSLFVFGGEYTPSAKGHEGAGVFHSDAWTFDLATKAWTCVSGRDQDQDEKEEHKGDKDGANDGRNAKTTVNPVGRGWMVSAALDDGKSVAIFGGLDAAEQRRNDMLIYRF